MYQVLDQGSMEYLLEHLQEEILENAIELAMAEHHQKAGSTNA
jgi:hypothetical protein